MANTVNKLLKKCLKIYIFIIFIYFRYLIESKMQSKNKKSV